jgi:hypothetical protein
MTSFFWFLKAVSGSQQSGDAMVAAMMETIIADVDIFSQASSDRIALYKTLAKLFTVVAIQMPQSKPQAGWEQGAAANLSALAPLPRLAFLLVAVENFSEAEAAEILDVDEGEFSDLLAPKSMVPTRRSTTSSSAGAPAHAIVLSVDEKSQIQALDRGQPGLPPTRRCGPVESIANIFSSERPARRGRPGNPRHDAR